MNNPFSRRRRLLVVSPSLTGGGAERFTSHLLTHLPQNNWETHLALLSAETTYDHPAGIEVTDLCQTGWGTVSRSAARLRKLVREFEPDTVLSTIDYATLFVGLALRKLPSPPRWVARLGLNPKRNSFSLRDAMARWALRFLYRDVDQFVANSHGLADQFRRQFPKLRAEITTIHNPVDGELVDRLAAAEAPHRKSAAPLLVAVGRLHRQKRFDLLLEAFSLLRQQMPVQLWILGSGPLEPQLTQQIQKAGWQNDVQLLGFQANPFPLVAQADLFVLTSDHEGLPNALLEAQALGIPAVATDCPFGPAEIILPGETGELVPVGDAKALAEKIERLLNEPERRSAYARQAREQIRAKFAMQSIIASWEAILQNYVPNRV